MLSTHFRLLLPAQKDVRRNACSLILGKPPPPTIWVKRRSALSLILEKLPLPPAVMAAVFLQFLPPRAYPLSASYAAPDISLRNCCQKDTTQGVSA